MQNWKKLSANLVYDGYRKITRKVFELPNGKQGDFEIINWWWGACVLAITADDQVILVQQYRPGPEIMFYELPGGGVDSNEMPIEAARRELIEETGYTGDLLYVWQYYIDAYNEQVRSIFVAQNCCKISAQKLDENEHIGILLQPLSEFRKNLRSLPMSDTAWAYLALDFLGKL
jgi:ADP-ribose pyrophosphatase